MKLIVISSMSLLWSSRKLMKCISSSSCNYFLHNCALIITCSEAGRSGWCSCIAKARSAKSPLGCSRSVIRVYCSEQLEHLMNHRHAPRARVRSARLADSEPSNKKGLSADCGFRTDRGLTPNLERQGRPISSDDVASPVDQSEGGSGVQLEVAGAGSLLRKANIVRRLQRSAVPAQVPNE